MRTHELASVLRGISDALSSMPDTEITSLPEMLKNTPIRQEPLVPSPGAEKKLSERVIASIEDIHETLGTLTKKEIVALIEEADIPVEVQSKDSAKTAARRVKTHLTAQPSAARKVKSIIRRRHSGMVSAPLSKALGILLGDSDEVSAAES